MRCDAPVWSSYDVAISACDKGEHRKQALIWLPVMWCPCAEPDVVIYNTAISAWDNA